MWLQRAISEEISPVSNKTSLECQVGSFSSAVNTRSICLSKNSWHLGMLIYFSSCLGACLWAWLHSDNVIMSAEKGWAALQLTAGLQVNYERFGETWKQSTQLKDNVCNSKLPVKPRLHLKMLYFKQVTFKLMAATQPGASNTPSFLDETSNIPTAFSWWPYVMWCQSSSG